ncbi:MULTISPECIES: LacI family DNA-binding transcriptional regulator [Microbacterium]|uniref:LacI family DNA-binding transcriptional regulator n=1 Tax=Microbacterium profundi TaxID=450380 RepID=A0ABV3LF74_9MICO|nr:LacI family DNA-binding transcriptional regulator [Microbacterium profundi]
MAERSTRRVTLADVAEAAGMSKSAVSMILNDRPGTRLSEDAVKRVRAAAEELGYRPDPAAQSLRLGRSKSIGFISDKVTLTRFASPMILGILDEAKARGRTVLIAETRGEPGELEHAVDAMLDRRVDGLLIGLMVARLIDVPSIPRGMPLVVVNGTTALDHPSILPDEWHAGHTVAEHLVAAGHRRIGIVGDLPRVMDDLRESATIPSRFEGMMAAFDAAGVAPERVEVDAWDPTAGYDGANRILDAHPDLTAVIAANDGVAFGVYQALGERGIRIPADVSVISFDDEELAGFHRPGLTTARLPYEEMGQRGIRMLLGENEPAHERVAMPLIVRDSVAGPRPV